MEDHGLISIFGFVVLLAWIFVDTRFRDGLAWRGFDSAAVVTQVKQLNELVTVRYSIQRVVGITEPKEPFGAESILLMVQGEVVAGVDLASMTPRNIVYSGGTIGHGGAPHSKNLQRVSRREADESLGSAHYVVDSLGTI